MILGTVQAHMLGFGGDTSLFVSVADGNAIAPGVISVYSFNGTSWLDSSTPLTASETWTSVTEGNDVFVAVASTGSNRASRSLDNGDTWITSTTPPTTSYAWNKVVYGGGKFIAISNSGYASYSTDDGDTWSSAYAIPVTTCIYVGSQFVGINGYPYNFGRSSYTSSDGITWSSASTITSNTQYTSLDIAHGMGKYVVVGLDGALGFSVFYSTNGTSWTQATGSGNSWEYVAYGNNHFVAVDGSGSGSNIYSADGINWSAGSSPSIPDVTGLAFGAGKFVATLTGANNVRYSTNNGSSWSSASLPLAANRYLTSITFG